MGGGRWTVFTFLMVAFQRCPGCAVGWKSGQQRHRAAVFILCNIMNPKCLSTHGCVACDLKILKYSNNKKVNFLSFYFSPSLLNLWMFFKLFISTRKMRSQFCLVTWSPGACMTPKSPPSGKTPKYEVVRNSWQYLQAEMLSCSWICHRHG